MVVDACHVTVAVSLNARHKARLLMTVPRQTTLVPTRGATDRPKHCQTRLYVGRSSER